MPEELKFVENFECAVVDFAILSRAATVNEITPDQVWSNLPKGGYTIERSTVVDCFNDLVEGGHLRKNGDKYTITDDGREDVQKLQPLALEIPQLVTNRNATASQQQRQGVPSQQTTGGSSSGTSGRSATGTATPQGNPNPSSGSRDSTQNKNR